MLSALKLLDLVVSVVACGVLGYVVDVLDLPLHGGRTEIIGIMLITYVLVIAAISDTTKQWPLTVPPRYLALLLLLCFIAVTEYARRSGPAYIELYQFMIFLGVLFYVEWRIAQQRAREFLTAFLAVAIGYMLVEATIALLADYAAAFLTEGELKQRNSVSYLALMVFFLSWLVGPPWIRATALLAAIVVPFANSTRAAMLLFAVLLCFLAVERILRNFNRLRRLVFLAAFVGALTWPLLTYLLLKNYIDLHDARMLEPTRYFVDDNYASAIARVLSNIALFHSLDEDNFLLGIGMNAAVETKILGYSSHSLIVVLLCGWGLAGLLLSVFLVARAYAMKSSAVALIVITIYSISNDLYAWMAVGYAVYAAPQMAEEYKKIKAWKWSAMRGRSI